MIYSAIGIMSGSSLDGLDLVNAVFTEIGGKWEYKIEAAKCYPYSTEWTQKLQNAIHLSAFEYQLLHTEYGHYLGQKVNEFINEFELHHKIHLIASHGHTTFHIPEKQTTAQLGDGAAIAAETKLTVISDLRNMDIAFGGQGAPIVPIGEKLLFENYAACLNIGGIANVSIKNGDAYIAYDICPANRVLNLIANTVEAKFDENGALAAKGKVNIDLLEKLNQLEYYQLSYPKSLSNSFGVDVIFPMITETGLSAEDALRTYVEHIVIQMNQALFQSRHLIQNSKLLITGGGAFNDFLIKQFASKLSEWGMYVDIPEKNLIEYKEALIMALIGVLRWREEINVLSSVTGATQNSIGGAMWLGAS